MLISDKGGGEDNLYHVLHFDEKLEFDNQKCQMISQCLAELSLIVAVNFVCIDKTKFKNLPDF